MTGGREPGGASGRSRPFLLPAGLLLAALVLLAWADVRAAQPTGPDAWPVLLEARDALDAPARLVTRPYLAESWSGARFLRPGFVGLHALILAAGAGEGLSLLAALAALWCTAWLVAATVFEASGGELRSGALLAGALVVLHPLPVDTLPALARRADLFSGALIAACVCLLLASRTRGGFARLAAGVACAAAAPLFKETGLLAAPLGVLALLAGGHAVGRGRRAWTATALLVVPFGAHLAWRLAVLGTIGRYDVVGRDVPFAARLASLAEGLFGHEGLPYAGAASAAAVAIAVGAALVAGRAAATPRRDRAAAPWLVALAWLLATGLLVAASERCRMRHAIALLPAAALAAGLGWNGLLRRARSVPRTIGLAASAAAVLLAIGPGSPLVHDGGPWTTSTAVAGRLIETARGVARTVRETGAPAEAALGTFRVAADLDGGELRVRIAPFPYRAAPARAPRVDGPMILMPYSVEAAVRWEAASPVPRVEPVGAQWAVRGDFLAGDAR